ncbi:MAG: thiamine diphosphokinase [Pseudobutyrivibrio sp.]|nr:thiamine diphosphokinase [Pseudobutyrivibrio sp.]
MNTAIIAGGMLEEAFIKAFVESYDAGDLKIIACDKGYDACERMGLKVAYAIGDFDSAEGGTLSRIKAAGIPYRVLNPVKDDTDTEAALAYAIDKSTPKDEIYLLGATGFRLDHLLGNVSLLGMGLKNNRVVIMMDSHNQIQMITSGETYRIQADNQFGKFISVFPYMGKVKGLTMEGFKYPLNNAELQGFNTLTVSNELTAPEGRISIKSGYLIVMETRD